MVFKSERLDVKELNIIDQDYFIELLSAPEIIEPIPQKKFTKEEILIKFNLFRDYSINPVTNEKTIWGVYETNRSELIGFCALLTNDEKQKEITYRFRKKYWYKGYGTEVARNLIEHCFEHLGITLLSADVNIENLGSVKILEKFFTPVKEFHNAHDNCTDRRYILAKDSWLLS